MNRNIIAFILALSLLSILTGCNQSEDTTPSQMSPPEVDVALPIKKSITEWDEYTGRFAAVDSVDLRSRVTGYLVEKKFRDGQLVKKGDVLFVIDPRTFEFQKEGRQAQYSLAKKEYDRAKNLRKTNSIAQEEVDRRLQELKAAEAYLNDANLDLEFTEVTSPISGRISDAYVDVGNLIRENDTLMTTINSLDPIHFEFDASQSQLMNYIRLDRAGDRPGSDLNPTVLFVQLPDEKDFTHGGRMDFVDNQIDPGSGTIRGRALIPNNDKIIYPGLFGRARLMGRAATEAILLPEKSIQTDQSSKFVYAIDQNNQAKRIYVEPGRVLDNLFVPIRKGLMGDERIVISGIQRIRGAAQPVTPKMIELEWTDSDLMADVNSVPSLEEIYDGGSNNSLRPADTEVPPSSKQEAK